MKIGKRIKRARENLGLSQKELADAMNKFGYGSITRSAIAMWERGETKSIEAANLLKAAKALGVDSEWLQFGRKLK